MTMKHKLILYQQKPGPIQLKIFISIMYQTQSESILNFTRTVHIVNKPKHKTQNTYDKVLL